MSNCILLSLPKDLEAQILEWSANNISDADLYNKDGKGREGSPHITAAYGIDDEDIETSVTKALREIGSFSIKTGDIGFFIDPEKDYHVIKIAVDHGPAEKLHEHIVDNVSMYDPTYEYHPHITLAYVKPGSCQDFVGCKDLSGYEADISSCLLMTDDEPKRINFGETKDENKSKTVAGLY